MIEKSPKEYSEAMRHNGYVEVADRIDSLITTIESQKEEIENLREMKIRRIEIENGAINFSIQGEAGMSFAAILLKFFEDNGGKNFFTFDVEKDGMRLSTTIENKHGELTVSEKLNQQSREIESLKAITESQKKEIEDLNNETVEFSKTIIDMNNHIGELEQKLIQQKAITELAVKGLEYVMTFPFLESTEDIRIIKRNCSDSLEEIQRLSNAQT